MLDIDNLNRQYSMLVYSSKAQCLNQFNSIQSDRYQVTNNIDEAFDYSGKKAGIFEMDWIRDNVDDPRLNDFSQIIVVATELWYNDQSGRPDMIGNLHNFIAAHPNWHFFAPGYYKDLSNHYFYPHWFGVAWYYQNALANELDLLETGTKPKLFDCLLGTYKPHRSYLYYRLQELGLNNYVICSYGRGGKTITSEEPKFVRDLYNIYGDPNSTMWVGTNHGVYNHGTASIDTDPDHASTGSSSTTVYKGVKLPISCVIPTDIYNQTAYTIVTETMYNCNFYTEKIVKPILAKRLFVVFGAAGYLEGLRTLGFKTFGDIIDESYDLESDDQTRWDMAIDQIKKLAAMNQDAVFDAVQQRVEYNQKLILDTNWQGDSVKRMQDIIASVN